MNRINIEDPNLHNLDDYTPFYKYKGELFTGIIYEENDKGQIVEEETFFEGKLHGISKRYSWTDGLIYEEQNFEHGLKQGWYKLWWQRNPDKPQEFIFFEKGEAIKYQKWNEQGKLTAQKFLSGEVIEWDNKGSVTAFCMNKKEPYQELRQMFYPNGSLKSQTIDAKIVGAKQLGFNEEYKEWNEKGILQKYKIWKFKKEKMTKYIVRYEFEQFFNHKGNLDTEIIITKFEKNIFQPNTHIWTGKKHYSYLDEKWHTYEETYQISGKTLQKSIKKEKAISLKYHKQHPYKFTK